MQTIRDPAALSVALDALAGRGFSAEHVLFDPETRVLSISLARRAADEPPMKVRNLGWLYRRWRVPLRETSLRVRRVRDHQIEPGEWRVSAVGFVDGIVSLYSGSRPVVLARVDALELSVEETPNIIGERIESCTLGFLRRYATYRSDGP